MNSKTAIKGKIHYVGVNDRNKHLFEGMWPLPYGVSYNSYLIDDEMVALVDTVDICYFEIYLRKIKSIIGERPIQYLIINHMEPDHSGSIRLIKQHYPDIIIVGNKQTFGMIEGFYGVTGEQYMVKDEDFLALGHHKLRFYMTPMVHWPETMPHEAIIPMEVYQAVQTEKARRRELGALANWSINTSCFTSKIKCGRCGKSYQRSNRKGRKDPNANYTIWICGTRRKTGNTHCQNKDIPEQMLKEACAAVLGLDTFDEIIFSEQIDRIEIPAPNEMIFYFKDGHIVPHRWESTMRKNCWTDERRAAKGRYVQEHQLGPNSSCFTSRIRCDSCGENYRRQRSRHKDGSFDSVWRCASGGKCNSPSIKEEVLKNLCADAMGLESFDETAFREQIACIHIVAPFQLSIRFFDGHTFEAAWENKRKMPKHTEQRKQHMREVMIQKWREKRGESNDDTGDDQPVHGNADQ